MGLRVLTSRTLNERHDPIGEWENDHERSEGDNGRGVIRLKPYIKENPTYYCEVSRGHIIKDSVNFCLTGLEI